MDFLVLSHLRWNFVFQRPQHLMTRFAKRHRVFFWEEPIFDTQTAFLDVQQPSPNLRVVVPHLPQGLSETEIYDVQKALMQQLRTTCVIDDFIAWYYTPLALHFTLELEPKAVIYDCMDELSSFRGAPPGLRAAELELFSRADLVFTGGQSLYEHKKFQHPSVHCFPSSIDREFFGTARQIQSEPKDQAGIAHPRLGYCGVIDERMDVELVAAVADARPEWQFVMIGPVVKISQAELPARPTIHYLGPKDYRSLPSYLAGWDAGILPFARNEATRFISPTKTPEYLAAGLPVVSTSIRDVVTPYGMGGLAEIADTADEFVAATERALASKNSKSREKKVEKFLSQISWDLTSEKMHQLIVQATRSRRAPALAGPPAFENIAAD